MVHHLLATKGDPEAAWCLGQAQEALTRLNAEMAARAPALGPVAVPVGAVSSPWMDGLSGLLGRLTGPRQPA
jgi:hypothetical protein